MTTQPALRGTFASRVFIPFASFAMGLLTTILLCSTVAAAVVAPVPLPKYNVSVN